MPRSINDYNSHDQRIWHDELEEFVPSRIFDAHIHMLKKDHLSAATPKAYHNWTEADFKDLQSWAKKLYPGRQVHFLVLGSPAPGIDVDSHNHWAIHQLASDPSSFMNRLITPQSKLEDIERDVRQYGFVGLKPYRLFSVTGDVDQCRIHEFLPHQQLELANQLGLWVTMHLSRYEGCADRKNLDDLEEFTTKRYPRIKWILAHCARSFTYWPIRQAVARLKQLPNIWYDVSAVTDVRPLITLFLEEDSRRIFFGSDGVEFMFFRGKYLALGRAWQALDTDLIDMNFQHCDGRPILAIYEQLLSMKHAAEIAGFSRDDIENVFWRNATEAFDIDWNDQ